MARSINFLPRFKAAGIHLGASACVAALAALLVFGLWYPWPYRVISGGQSLFVLLTSVDVVIGPLLTFAVFNLNKGWPHLRRDLAIIAVLQLAALAYGLYTVYVVRPVILAYEVDRFRVVASADVLERELEQALPEFRTLSIIGPKLVGTRAAKTSDEKMKAVELGVRGFDISSRPIFWQPYVESRKAVLTRARPVAVLKKQYPARLNDIEQAIEASGRPSSQLVFLPLTARRADWIVLLDSATADIVGFAQFDGFF
jgi:hypothetical protein